ncbi:MAG: DUF262 domain-containing protein [Gemmatimonadota bacterium]
MPKIFYPSSEKLKFLRDTIHHRELALPDFQRDFVWDPRATEMLIESICQNFPAGSLLRIRNSGFYFAPRQFQGAPSLDGHEPSYLILDGQQRLTSLYQALYGKGSHRYYIDLSNVISGFDLEDCVFHERKLRGERKYGTIEKQASTFIFPFEKLFSTPGGFEEWLDQIVDIRSSNEGDQSARALRNELRDARRHWLTPIEDYEFPMVTLADDTSADAVCTIFETLNRTGVKLSVFDLLVARFWPEKVRLRERWEKALADHPILAEFEVDPYYLLQALALSTARGAPSCKRTDVLKLDLSQIHEGWDSVVWGLGKFLRILREDCGVILPQWLPYMTMLIPAAAILGEKREDVGPRIAELTKKITQWFWCSVFGQAYENAPNSQAAKDLVELRRWMEGGVPPETVANFSFDVSLLRQITPRQRAIYRGVVALILRNGARDFHTGRKIDSAMMVMRQIDDHHVFSDGYLPKDVPHTLRNCVLNRTLIDKATNIRIGKRSPSVYLSEIRDSIGSAELTNVLSSHLLPSSAENPLWRDDFEGFIEERQSLISARLEGVTHV